MITPEGTKITGTQRFAELAKSLSAKFGESTIQFSKDQAIFENQITNIGEFGEFWTTGYCRPSLCFFPR